jgi:hypothetical protein
MPYAMAKTRRHEGKVSHKPSGLWCDLCGNPILSGDWWHIGINNPDGSRDMGHSCQKCKDEYEKRKPADSTAREK